MKRILVVDDIRENRYLLEVLLKGHGYEVESASNGAEALEMARCSPPDLIVADILMPVMDGYALCREWNGDPVLSRVPFVFYTATYTEPQDREFALSLGAERFVIKPQEPERLVSIVSEVLDDRSGAAPSERLAPERKPDEEYLQEYNRALFRKLEKKLSDVERLNRTLSSETAERRKLEEIVSNGEEQLRNLLDTAPAAIAWADMEGGILFVNRMFVNMFGYQQEELPTVERWMSLAYPDVLVRMSMIESWRHAQEADSRGDRAATPVEARVKCRDGSVRDVSVLDTLLNDIHLTIFTDLTGHRILESQLLQAQKMEVIGHLAGGVAHDFNNILTAIVGYGHLLMAKVPPESPSREYLEQILNATDRGARLTRSIFDFTRKRTMDIIPVRLNRVIGKTDNFLRRLISETIDLKTELCAEDVTIMADPGQIEQLIMNLVTNARDAIVGNGAITIATERIVLDDESGKPGSKGDYALLTVTDTGQGMDEETKNRIFEPFFTTKESGKGTGLGLSVVQGVVRRHNGHISVLSEPGKGTRFCVYLPSPSILNIRDEREESCKVSGGNETILLAEDNECSLLATALNLRELGYDVIEARDGEQAVDLLASHGKGVALLLVDIVMPKRNGWEVYREAASINPGVKVIFLSGYPDDVADTGEILDGKHELLTKPVHPALLSAKVRELLDGSRGNP